MKLSVKSIMALSLGLAASLEAQPAGVTSDGFSVDEAGRGVYLSDYNSIGLLYPMIGTDPSGGITNSPVLIYDLGAYVAAGDVALMRPGQATISKLIRFFPAGGGDTFMIYYSQPDGTPAGVGIPPSAHPVFISETNNPTTWFPTTTNQPGFSLDTAFPEYFTGFEYYIHGNNHTEPVHQSGTNLVWNYSSPFSFWHCVVMSATNASVPLTNWLPVLTNQCDRVGNCTLTLPIFPDKPQAFYQVIISR